MAFMLNHVIEQDILLRNMVNDYKVKVARPGHNQIRYNVFHPDNDYVSHFLKQTCPVQM